MIHLKKLTTTGFKIDKLINTNEKKIKDPIDIGSIRRYAGSVFT